MKKPEMKNALLAANALYVSRKGASANLNKDGVNPDIAAAVSTLESLNDAAIQRIAEVCDIASAFSQIAQASNIKKALRALDTLALLATDDLRYCRASAKVFMVEYAGLLSAGVKTREGLRYVATGSGNENTSDAVKIAQARKLYTALGKTALNSIQTQESVSWSKGGLGEILGAIVPGSGARGKKPEIIEAAPIVKALNAWFSRLTDGKIALIAEQGKGKK